MNAIAPGDVWFLDFRRRVARRLVAFSEPQALLSGAVSVGESTNFLLTEGRRARLFLFRGDRVRPLIDLRGTDASLSPLLKTPQRAYFLLRWEYWLTPAASEPSRAALYVFDGRALLRSSDFPSLFDADIGARGRLIALAYRTKRSDRIVVAELADRRSPPSPR